jgi:hypothetical protein
MALILAVQELALLDIRRLHPEADYQNPWKLLARIFFGNSQDARRGIS